MAESPKRIGLVGAGYISDLHLGALASLDGLEAVAMCDRSPGRAEGKAHHYGDLAVYSDVADMLATEALDAVHVLTPAQTHEAIVADIVGKGIDVFVEKPFAINAASCERVTETADAAGAKLGVSHNMLFDPSYQKLRSDVASGRFGRIDHIDIVCNRPFGPLRAGPHTGWLFDEPGNALLELGPHSAAFLLDLMGDPDELTVLTGDTTTLPTGREFHRRWDMLGMSDGTGIRLCWAFGDGFPEFFIHVRGRSAAGTLDLQNGSYTVSTPGRQILEVDAFVSSAKTAARQLLSAGGAASSFVRGKMGDSGAGGYYERSFRDAIRAFHTADGQGALDHRLSPELGLAAVGLLERIVDADPHPLSKSAGVVDTAATSDAETTRPEPTAPAEILLVGGTGFIGRSVVASLVDNGHGVRVASRSGLAQGEALNHRNTQLVSMDFTDSATVASALEGVHTVGHLAFGAGSTWADVLKYDVEPTVRLAEAAAEAGVRRFVFSSTIAIYWAGKRARVITEDTPPDPGIMRANPYAHGKVEVEERLREIAKRTGMEVIVVRPGIVVGPGTNPVHWGVGAWPNPTVCAMWGTGDDPMPFVDVDDCGAAIATCLTTDHPLGSSYNLVGDVLLTGNEYLDAIEKGGDIRITRVKNQPARYFLDGGAKWTLKTLGGDKSATRPSWRDADGRTLRAHFDNTAAKRDLGWEPMQDRAEFTTEVVEAMASTWFA